MMYKISTICRQGDNLDGERNILFVMEKIRKKAIVNVEGRPYKWEFKLSLCKSFRTDIGRYIYREIIYWLWMYDIGSSSKNNIKKRL